MIKRIRKITESMKFRRSCRDRGMNETSSEILTYINMATDSGEKGPEVFESLSRLERLQLAVVEKFGSAQPHVNNIRRLYTDPSFRDIWCEKFNKYFPQ